MKKAFSIRQLLFAIVLVTMAGTACAQLPDYHLQLFDYTSGIQPGTISSVSRDKKGCLWVLYRRQVQRFDGKRTVTFKQGQLLDNLLCDEAGHIWVTGSNKIYLFSEENGDFRQVYLSSPDSSIISGPVFQLNDKTIVLLTSKGIFKYDAAAGLFKPWVNKLPMPAIFALPLSVLHDDLLFYQSGHHIVRYDIHSTEIDSIPSLDFNRLYPVSRDSIAVSSWDNKTYWVNFKEKTEHVIELPAALKKPGFAFFSVRSMVEFIPNRFLIASREGIYEYNNKTKEFCHPHFFLNGRKVGTSDYVNHLYLDNDGYAWMATIDGVARFAIKNSPIGLARIRQLNDELPAGIDNIRKIEEDEKGNLWLATGNGFVSWKANRRDLEFFLPSQDRNDKLNHPSVRGLMYDGKNIILGPTDKGMWIYDPATRKYRRPVYASDSVKTLSETDFIDDIAKLNNGDGIVMGRRGIYVISAKTYQLVQLPLAMITFENPNFAHQGKDGIIWITTNRGLHCLDSNYRYLQKSLFPDASAQIITSSFMTSNDRLLFSCEQGLYTARYHQGKIVIEKETNVFDHVNLYTIYQDDHEVIWASSQNGIYRYDPATFKLNLFDYSDNVQGYGFNGNSWFRDRQGVLYFGGVNGINYWNPDTFTPPAESFQVYINQASIGNKDSLIYSFANEVSIPYTDRSMEVEFAVAYFNNAEKVTYRYQLEGFDKDWKYLGNNNVVRFTSLPPGNYRLKVQASLNRVDWVDAKNSFLFEIKSPYWMAWWFISVLVIAAASIIWMVVRNRNKKIQEKQEELEAEQAINYFAASIYETNSVKAILWDVAKNCIGRLHFEDCVIYLLDHERKVLIQRAAHGPKSPASFEIKEPMEIPLGKGITGSVAASGKAELIPDTTKDPRYIVDDERRFSEITVPIISNGRVLGVIDCEHSKKGFFTQKHLSILTTIASLCANKIVKAKAEAERAKAEAILMDTQKKMADVEMQALRAQMNPHFIFNCLNSINRYIVKSDQATASLYLTRFAKLIRLILDNSNSKSVTLSNEMEALRLYIEMESIRFDKKFSYKITLGEGVQSDSIYVPPLIIQPYVENAIWHGLLHKETAGHLTIHISRESNCLLECSIEDNGVGREKAKELRSKSAPTKKSLGMKLTEDRLALLNKQIQAEASVEVLDLIASDGEPAGTKVILKIPIDG
ncbi:histidine kinase [Terrimonas sp. NA20]|uniref:Histidine kinase n=1 Tax=Terrimonas ginsenosidimutans TaxID=2908004 RepID=A0ABS9KLH7_9BACT|nr:histidine kinase [Terrimonas ginsenosidimutans]MCG2613176.1 histidine kinase [Terrimonas ginsenosidimutans]